MSGGTEQSSGGGFGGIFDPTGKGGYGGYGIGPGSAFYTDPAGFWVGKMSGGGGGNQVPETPLQKEQAQVAQQTWADYQKRWVPVQEFYMRRAQAGGPEYEEGRANTDVRGRFGTAQKQVEGGLNARGAASGSGSYLAGETNLSADKGAALGLTKTNVDSAVDREYANALQDIIQIGRGQRASADTSLSTISDISGKMAAEDAAAAAQESAGMGQAIGTGIGIGGGYGLSSMMSGGMPRTPTPSGQPASSPYDSQPYGR